MMFMHRLRMLHPQFAQQSPRGGGFMQQDAEELYSALLNTLALNLKDVSGCKVDHDRYHTFACASLCVVLRALFSVHSIFVIRVSYPRAAAQHSGAAAQFCECAVTDSIP